VIASRGLRRGEGCGLRWEASTLMPAFLAISTQLVEYDGEIHESASKNDAGTHGGARQGIRPGDPRHHLRMLRAKLAADEALIETGRVFAP
jgi:hypothetical protein